MSDEVRIYLNEKTYSPGQTLVGRVECNFSSIQNIEGIRVKLSGKCITSWTETESFYDDVFKQTWIQQVLYSGEEVYFEKRIDLTGSITLLSGRQVYDFSYKLADGLPSSYKGSCDWGSIQYRVKAVVDREWKLNSKAETTFTVFSPLNLNDVPGIKEPVHISEDKVLCSCCCTNNRVLTFKFSLPSSGYIPGQDVAIGACIQNLTGLKVEQVKFKIIQKTEFKTRIPNTSVKVNKETVAAGISGVVGGGGEKSWTTVLTIPKDGYFPNLYNCDLIEISYDLKAEVVLPMPHSNLKAEVPITIGDIQFARGDDGRVHPTALHPIPPLDSVVQMH